MIDAKQLIVFVGITLAGCLIEPNPDFVELETGGTGLDVGLETTGAVDCMDGDDPMNCGSCGNQCMLAGELTECVNGSCVGSVTLSVIDDAHVDTEQPDQNFGASPILWVDESHDAYLALPGLDQIPVDATIDSVTLHLTGITASANASLEIHRVESQWTELDVTADNAPAINGTALRTMTPEVGHNTVELVDLLNAWENGSSHHTLAFRGNFGGDDEDNEGGVVFVSSEGGVNPYLIITLSW